MDDNRRGSNIFELYASNKLQDRFAAGDAGHKGETLTYNAYDIDSEKQEWLQFHLDNGLIRMLPYRDLLHVICAPSGWLGLQYNSCIVTMEGKNLVSIVTLIQLRHLSSIYCFVDGYPAVDDEEATVVTHLKIQTYTEAGEEREQELATSPEV